MNAIPRSVIALGMLAACSVAAAFGPKAHLWTGEQILGELRSGCNIELASNAYAVAPELCAAITANPETFYAGVLGPDVYPDLAAGQDTVHSGVKDGWETAEFLEHVVASANTPSSRAFAAGYLVHAAGDVFGHSYVNTYAGDAWNMSDERLVELRHAVIEKYIDAHIPPLASGATSFRAPAEFVRDTLIHNGKTQGQYQRAALARHLASMMNVKAKIDELATRTDSLSGAVSDALARSVEFTLTLAGQLLDGEAALALASAALEGPKARAATQRNVVEAERKAVADAADAVERHEGRLAELESEAQAQQQAAAAASAAARQSTDAANEMRAQLSRLEIQIRSVPSKVVVTVCHTLTDPMCDALCPEGSANPLCALCNVPRQACTNAERDNAEYQRLNDQIIESKQRLGDLESAAVEDSAKAEAASAAADTLLQERATEAEAEPGILAARTTAETSYHVADEQYNAIASTVAVMQARVDELRGRAEQSRKKLVDAKAIAEQLRTFTNQLNVLSHVLHNWQSGIDHAASALVAASDRVGQAMLGGRIHLFSEYRRWLACEGAAYLAEPYQVADVPCAVESAAQRLQALLDDIANVILPEPARRLVGQLDELRVKIDTELRAAITGATTELVRFVSNPTTADFVDLLMNPEHATRAKLNEVLARADDRSGKEILVFDNGADLIDRDIGLRDGTLDPEQFVALSAALTLAKLSLLDQTEMRRLVLEIGGSEARAIYDAGRFDVGKSILLTAVRSLDGNEQWQPYGLLYPRRREGGAPANAFDRHYGFGPRDATRHGFPLFVDPVLRQRVFLKLFPKQIHGEVAKRPEMAPDRFAFSICDSNPFPVTFLPSGDPAPSDDGCSSLPPRAGPQ